MKVVYQVSEFAVGAPPAGRIEAYLDGEGYALRQADEPGVAYLYGILGTYDITFRLVQADNTPLANAQASVTVQNVTIQPQI